jgi:hypothetical protein
MPVLVPYQCCVLVHSRSAVHTRLGCLSVFVKVLFFPSLAISYAAACMHVSRSAFAAENAAGRHLLLSICRLSLVSLPHHVFSTVVDELQPNKPNTAVLECTVWHFMHWWTLLGICDHAAVWCG